MKRRWLPVSRRELEVERKLLGCQNVPEWYLLWGKDYKEFSFALHQNHDGKQQRVDLEMLLDEPRIDVQRRKAPVVLFLVDTIGLIDRHVIGAINRRDRNSVASLVRGLVPPGYTVLASNKFTVFYSDFYTGLDDALPSMVVATENSRVNSMLDDEGYYLRLNLREVCERRGIPFIEFPGGHYECKDAAHVRRIRKYLRDVVPKVAASLPPVDEEHFAKMFGVYYPIGEFEDRGRMVRMPYSVMGGERIPIIASATMVVQKDGMYLMMQEAKKGSGERRIDRSRWEFPAGRIEEGEQPDEAALRELSEETPYQGVVNGLIGVFARVNANGRLIMKAAYTGAVNGRHAHPLADDSLGYGFFDRPTIMHLKKQRLLKTSDQLAILQEAARIGINRSVYDVADVAHPGVVRLLGPERSN